MQLKLFPVLLKVMLMKVIISNKSQIDPFSFIFFDQTKNI